MFLLSQIDFLRPLTFKPSKLHSLFPISVKTISQIALNIFSFVHEYPLSIKVNGRRSNIIVISILKTDTKSVASMLAVDLIFSINL